jgi:hypothetical protein
MAKKNPPNQPGLTVWVTNDDEDGSYVYLHLKEPTRRTKDNVDGCWESDGRWFNMCASVVAAALAPRRLPRRWQCRKCTARLTP